MPVGSFTGTKAGNAASSRFGDEVNSDYLISRGLPVSTPDVLQEQIDQPYTSGTARSATPPGTWSGSPSTRRGDAGDQSLVTVPVTVPNPVS
jgi:hypothetical protein